MIFFFFEKVDDAVLELSPEILYAFAIANPLLLQLFLGRPRELLTRVEIGEGLFATRDRTFDQTPSAPMTISCVSPNIDTGSSPAAGSNRVPR